MSDVVVLRALGLGDTLAAVPALRALRRGLEGERIVLAGPAQPGGLLVAAGVVDEVRHAVGLDRLDVGPIGLAVNLHGRGPESHQLLLTGGAREIVGFCSPEAGIDGPAWRAGEPERARWCRVVTSRWDVGCDPDDVRLDLPTGFGAGSPRLACPVVVHPGAAAGARRWPVERWAVVVRALAATAQVALTGSRDERGLCRAVAREAGLPESSVVAGSTSLPGLAALVARARVVLSGDTGVAHLAYACATPSVTLFGPTRPQEWGPPASGPHTALWFGSGAGDPHGRDSDPALLRITPSEVLAAAAEVAR